MSPIELVFATGNRAKLAQLAFVIAQLGAPIRVISAHDKYGSTAEYIEQGTTAAAVSWRGACEVAERIGVPVIVEDSTFHVELMQGAPGIHAGKYLKEHGRAGILKALGNSPRRNAHIISAVTWAAPEGDTQTWMQAVPGHIARREWSTNTMPEWVGPTAENPLGGGYNSIFIPQGHTRTLSEISAVEGVIIGYREPNFCALIRFLTARDSR